MSIKRDLREVRNILFKEYIDLKKRKITTHEANTTRKMMDTIVETYRTNSLHSVNRDKK